MSRTAHITGRALLLLGACLALSSASHAQLIPASAQASFETPDRLPARASSLGALRPDARSQRSGITVETQRYSVTQSDRATLMSGLREAAAGAGIPKLGRTQWNVRWRYDYKRRLGRCSVGEVTTTLRVKYILPDWQPANPPALKLRERVESFARALDVHEYGHALIGLRAKQDIQRMLSDASLSNADCDEVGEQLNALAQARIERARVEGRAYDAQTGHGKTQGAYLSLRGL